MVAANARAPRDGKFLEIVSLFFFCCCCCFIIIISYIQQDTAIILRQFNRIPSPLYFYLFTYLYHFVCLFSILNHLLLPSSLKWNMHSTSQKVGTYNPIPNKSGIKEIRLKTDRLRYWIGVGAQPSDRVAWLLGKFGILPPPPPKFNPQKMIPKKDRIDKKKK